MLSGADQVDRPLHSLTAVAGGDGKSGRRSRISFTNALGDRVPPYFASFGAGEAASFWKRGSFRSGSNIGSSRRSAGVSGTREASAPSEGIDNSFSNEAMAR